MKKKKVQGSEVMILDYKTRLTTQIIELTEIKMQYSWVGIVTNSYVALSYQPQYSTNSFIFWRGNLHALSP